MVAIVHSDGFASAKIELMYSAAVKMLYQGFIAELRAVTQKLLSVRVSSFYLKVSKCSSLALISP